MSSISGLMNAVPNTPIRGTQAAYQGSQKATVARNEESGAPDRVRLSKTGKMFQELSELQSSDPEKFKAVLTEAADRLRTAAKDAGDTKKADLLNNLADRFQQAAATGDLTALQPQAAPRSDGYSRPVRGGRPHGAGGPPPPPPPVEDEETSTSSDASEEASTLLSEWLDELLAGAATGGNSQ